MRFAALFFALVFMVANLQSLGVLANDAPVPEVPKTDEPPKTEETAATGDAVQEPIPDAAAEEEEEHEEHEDESPDFEEDSEDEEFDSEEDEEPEL